MATVRTTYNAEYNRLSWRHFDVWLVLIVLALLTIGLLMISSATQNSVDPDLANAARRQGLYALVGVIILILTATIDYRIWYNARHVLYVLALLFLVITLIFGSGEIGGVGRWLNLSLFPVQPSELAKVLLILALAGFLANRIDSIRTLRTTVLSLLYVAAPALLVFVQPNLSTAMVYLFIWLAMVVAAGVRGRNLAIIGGVGLLTLPAVWLAMAQYQRDRVLSIFSPDPGYNPTQALIAIGSGGWLGQGYGSGSQSQLHFLKVRHTDFIFSVTAEELGFIGAVLILILFGLLVYRLVRIADRSRDAYGEYAVIGIAAMIFFQAAINIAMNLNIGLVAGLPLPFVSYGGSSLITMLLAVGIAESVIMRHRKIEF
ncbi:MAG TPA: FtsW/RodA/SpoVE family cell cycle protein [Anaerolineae bacterium]|nr:FtsW/RodA/SpoVE family cell cycle protein [Anaerolineae bacterium]